MVGLTKNSLYGYSESNVYNRLRSNGYDPDKMYDFLGRDLIKKNPIGWLNTFMDSSRVQMAPQEAELTAYKKMGTENNLSTGLGSLKF